MVQNGGNPTHSIEARPLSLFEFPLAPTGSRLLLQYIIQFRSDRPRVGKRFKDCIPFASLGAWYSESPRVDHRLRSLDLYTRGRTVWSTLTRHRVVLRCGTCGVGRCRACTGCYKDVAWVDCSWYTRGVDGFRSCSTCCTGEIIFCQWVECL